jgi:hypothetical protein
MAEFVTIVGTLSEPCPAAVGKETSTRAVDTAITFQGSSMTPLFGLPTPSGASVTIYGRDSLGTVRGLQDSLGTALFSSSLARLHVHGAKRNDIYTLNRECLASMGGSCSQLAPEQKLEHVSHTRLHISLVIPSFTLG